MSHSTAHACLKEWPQAGQGVGQLEIPKQLSSSNSCCVQLCW